MVTYNVDHTDNQAYHEFIDSFDIEWNRKFGETDNFIVETRNHTWQNLSGEFEKQYSSGHELIEEVLEGVKYWRIKVDFKDKKCHIKLTSHDNSIPAEFEVYPK